MKQRGYSCFKRRKARQGFDPPDKYVDGLKAEPDCPLMSARGAKILIITQLFGTKEQVATVFKQMEERHRKRQADIDRYYKKQKIARDKPYSMCKKIKSVK